MTRRRLGAAIRGRGVRFFAMAVPMIYEAARANSAPSPWPTFM
jgi:hypothetical protein